MFGIMVAKGRILQQPIITMPKKLDTMMKAIGVLYNFMQGKEGMEVDYDVGRCDRQNGGMSVIRWMTTVSFVSRLSIFDSTRTSRVKPLVLEKV